MATYDKLTHFLHKTHSQVEFKHDNGELSQVLITEANMGRKRVRLASLPPEVPNSAIQTAMAVFGQITTSRTKNGHPLIATLSIMAYDK
jgi:hypothetical protein